MIDNLTNPKTTLTLPSTSDPLTLPSQFAKHFTDKVQDLMNTIDGVDLPGSYFTASPDVCHSSMSSFLPVSLEQVKTIVVGSPNKSCHLDPIPTVLLIQCVDDLLQPLTSNVNFSLESGLVPDPLKYALITPILKKKSLDRDVLANYRPISNLPFLSKVLERAVSSQLHGYLDLHGLYSNMQSAYRRRYSTETALLHVQNDLLWALDGGNKAVLVLLDFSSAFDTIDHPNC